jgi:hypothetical protein
MMAPKREKRLKILPCRINIEWDVLPLRLAYLYLLMSVFLRLVLVSVIVIIVVIELEFGAGCRSCLGSSGARRCAGSEFI